MTSRGNEAVKTPQITTDIESQTISKAARSAAAHIHIRANA